MTEEVAGVEPVGQGGYGQVMPAVLEGAEGCVVKLAMPRGSRSEVCKTVER